MNEQKPKVMMNNATKGYKSRIVDGELRRKLASAGAVLIEGPKWCGKTTTGKQAAKSAVYMTDRQSMQLAEVSLSSVLRGEAPLLVDEWQVKPELWDAARHEIDHRGERGQFIFTGSATPADRSKILHSGAGRFSWLRMRPMSLWESGESRGEVSLKELFEGKKDIFGESDIEIDELAYLLCRGGWPGALGMSEESALSVSSDYLEAIINADLEWHDGVRRSRERMWWLLRSLARHQGTQTANTMLRDDIAASDGAKIDEETVANYVDALRCAFVVEDAPAWNPNLRSKTAVRSSAKRYFVDPSIATAALGAGPKDLTEDLNTMGLILETLCMRDLRVYSQGLRGEVYHYRDKSGLECDAVVHLRNGKYGLIEIKLGGERLVEEGAANLKKLADKIDTEKMREPEFMTVITGLGRYAYKREDGVIVAPVGSLRD